MTALFPDLSVTVSQRRWACVLDPTLTLSEYGLPLVKQLGEVMDLWVVREFWHILDNTYFYWQQPEFAFQEREKVESATATQQRLSYQVISALREWERLRGETDLGGLNLFWIGDGIGESFLPKETDTRIVGRWELLARSLENQQNGQQDASEPLTSAFRDAAALAASLGSTFILTYRSPEDMAGNLPPAICSSLMSWGVPCQEVEREDAIASLERDHLRQLLIQAGLAKFLWMGLHLTVLHLVVPNATAISLPLDWSEEFSLAELGEWPDSQKESNLWEGAKGFWYGI
jgi:hypothetical protein